MDLPFLIMQSLDRLLRCASALRATRRRRGLRRCPANYAQRNLRNLVLFWWSFGGQLVVGWCAFGAFRWRNDFEASIVRCSAAILTPEGRRVTSYPALAATDRIPMATRSTFEPVAACRDNGRPGSGWTAGPSPSAARRLLAFRFSLCSPLVRRSRTARAPLMRRSCTACALIVRGPSGAGDQLQPAEHGQENRGKAAVDRRSSGATPALGWRSSGAFRRSRDFSTRRCPARRPSPPRDPCPSPRAARRRHAQNAPPEDYPPESNTCPSASPAG